MAALGIVGLGLIGGALAKRLINSGETPMVFDLKPDTVKSAVADGAIAAGSSAELAAACDIVLVCVQTDDDCVAAISGDGGVLEGATPGTCVAVLSTVMPGTIIELAGQAAERGVDLVDTPVAGRGMFSVEEGSMTALVGDDGDLVARLEPTLSLFASTVVPAGRLGSGAALKLAHNVVVYAGFAATVEAVELATAAGVRDGLVEEVASTSGALSDLSAMYMRYYKHFRDDPHTASEDEALHVAAALLDKDLGDAVSLAESHGVALPVASLLSHSGARVFPAD
jgi:3-hydroxyisobutyrate dehydrogenase-like beta-hydroxyacid dehydrogenase